MTETPTTPTKRTASLFDIRTIVGALLLIYGVILLLVAAFGTSSDDLAKSDGVNLNLWTGLALTAAGIVFGLWARLRPTKVVAAPSEDDGRPRQH